MTREGAGLDGRQFAVDPPRLYGEEWPCPIRIGRRETCTTIGART